MITENVSLVFPSLNQLWGFVREAKINYTECISMTLTLVCDCQQSDITLAKEKYGAKM
jgi:hypothetical protein